MKNFVSIPLKKLHLKMSTYSLDVTWSSGISFNAKRENVRSSSIPSNLNFITGTNASSTAYNKFLLKCLPESY